MSLWEREQLDAWVLSISQYFRKRKEVHPVLRVRLKGTILTVLIERSDNQSVEIGESVDLEPLITEAVDRALTKMREDKP